jgi:hypothetical protein
VTYDPYGDGRYRGAPAIMMPDEEPWWGYRTSDETFVHHVEPVSSEEILRRIDALLEATEPPRLYLTPGRLDIGVWRDSSVDNQIELETFIKTFDPVLVASGGVTPISVDYNLDNWTVTDRPLASMEWLGPTRGGASYRTPPTYPGEMTRKERREAKEATDGLRRRAQRKHLLLKWPRRIRYGKYGKGRCRHCGNDPDERELDWYDD